MLRLVVSASNGTHSGELEIYESAEELRELARSLRRFPKAPQDTISWELGSEDPEENFRFYFCLRIRTIPLSGPCALELRLNNNREPPDREVAEFTIRAYPADLDRLSDLLLHFCELKHRVLEWNITDGALHEES